jgi:hypothetical protein
MIATALPIFPVLSRLRIHQCPGLEAIIINGTSLERQLGGYLPSLKIVDVQTPSLRKCFLTELVSLGNGMFFKKYRIPIFIVEGGGIFNLSFVEQF